MRILLLSLTISLTLSAHSQTEENKILAQANKFSEYLMTGQNEMVVSMYTEDAKIFPNNQEILSGEDLADYWNPKTNSSWKTTYHKLTPVEVKILGEEAYDYGYYEGTSANGEDTSNWKGKYVIVWRRESGEWKIYLDIWNGIKD